MEHPELSFSQIRYWNDHTKSNPDWWKAVDKDGNFDLKYFAVECPTCGTDVGFWCRQAADTPPCKMRVLLWKALGRPYRQEPGEKVPELIVKMLEATADE